LNISIKYEFVGGIYGNKVEEINRFVRTYDDNSKFVDDTIRRRLVIENVQ
jgi:UV DNA damage repair endonuclease